MEMRPMPAIERLIAERVEETIYSVAEKFIGRPLTQQTLLSSHCEAEALCHKYLACEYEDLFKQAVLFAQKLWVAYKNIQDAQHYLAAEINIQTDGNQRAFMFLPYDEDRVVSWDGSFLNKPLYLLDISMTRPELSFHHIESL